MNIPFNKSYCTGAEIQYMQDAIARNKTSGDGFYTKKVNQFMEQTFGAEKALYVTSGSAALDMAAILIDLRPGDEVILPSYTFVSTANSVVLRGAKPVFAEIDPRTMNINPDDIEKKITDKTKSIWPVHYAGVSCDMDRIMRLAEQYNLKVVEDAAQGVNAKYKGQYLGTIGHIGCYSFHETKNYSSGEGGAILINDKTLIERAEIIREKGTNRSKFFRGEVDKYTWVDIVSSYLGSDILAAHLYAQFEKLDEINNKRKFVFEFYYEHLKRFEQSERLILPFVPDHCETNYHMFYIILPTSEQRNWVMDRLKEAHISAVFHYVPLHSSDMGRKLGNSFGQLPLTEEYSGRLLRLPMHANLTEVELDYIIKCLSSILEINDGMREVGSTQI